MAMKYKSTLKNDEKWDNNMKIRRVFDAGTFNNM
jgi:hypothetical protein